MRTIRAIRSFFPVMFSLVPVVFLFAVIPTLGCDQPPGDEQASEDGVAVSQEGLMASYDPLMGSICRACGCSWVSRPDPTTGCNTYRCECDSTDKAKCVVNAPGGVAAIVVQPPVIKYMPTAPMTGMTVAR
jgi:hypothetical protein